MGRSDEDNLRIRQKMIDFDKAELLMLADKLDESLRHSVKVAVVSKKQAKEIEKTADFVIIKDN